MLRPITIKGLFVKANYCRKHQIQMDYKRSIIQALALDIRWVANRLPQFLCGACGGHRWTDWVPRASYNVLHERRVEMVRRCLTCEKDERVRAKDDTPNAIEPPIHI